MFDEELPGWSDWLWLEVILQPVDLSIIVYSEKVGDWLLIEKLQVQLLKQSTACSIAQQICCIN